MSNMPVETKQGRRYAAVFVWLGLAVCAVLLAVGLLCYFSVKWYMNVYGAVEFSAVLHTLTDPMNNVETGLIVNYIQNALVPVIVSASVLCALLFFKPRRSLVLLVNKSLRCRLYPLSRPLAAAVSLLLAGASLAVAARDVGLVSYFKKISTATPFIEEHYRSPESVSITFPEQKRNLIVIYLESMETTFLPVEHGGGNDVNPIPELFELAQDNVNFSQNDSVGGFRVLEGSGWTSGALVSLTSGVPLKSTFFDMGKNKYLPGLCTLTDILHENGYYQTLMVGSDATFGDREKYFSDHGVDHVYDLFTAQQDGIVPQDYFVWWGMEDMYLFQYAKQELAEIAAREQPFCFSMLTVDTHHVGGYVCALCGNEYTAQYDNVMACSSRQVSEFVEWIRQQEFYENTTIVITGDHCTMDAEFVEAHILPEADRRVYNCFINAPARPKQSKNREFCTLDMFPTMLSSIGCSIEGDRLGLGTDLFSGTPTLCEELGADTLNAELANYSEFYASRFE